MGGQPSSQQQFRAEHFAPTLHRRVLRPAREPYVDFFQIFALFDGRAAVEFSGERHELSSRSVFSFPAAVEPQLTLSSGADAYVIGVSQELLVDVIGNEAESVLMRIFTERPGILAGEAVGAETFSEIAFLIRGVLKEATLPGRGSHMAIAAYVRLIVMALRREGDWEEAAPGGHGLDVATLQRFRQLVELHFRERRPISFYADALGLTHDRLHAICTRTLERTPKKLLNQRILHEANLRLERSGSSIQDIAIQLGFPDQTYFSHFYKRETGISPHRFRSDVLKAGHGTQSARRAEYAEWP